MAAIVTGDKALDRKLRQLATKSARAAMVSGTRGSLAVYARAARREITASSAPTRIKQEARKTIGSRFVKGGTNRMGKTTSRVAKVGVAVGKKAKQEQARPKKQKGVGISLNNIHWATLGTNERTTKSGKSTGAMPAYMLGLMGRVLSGFSATALAEARKRIWKWIERDATKKK